MAEWTRALFDDNPAALDLLGLRPVAAAIAASVVDPNLNPVAVGINSPWGGGKSTALRLVQAELESMPTVLVVSVDPWEFVDSGDPRGTLIARVLDGLEVAYRERADGLNAEATIGEQAKAASIALATKLSELRRRISWAKVAQVALKSAITMTPDLVGFVDALTPKPEATSTEAIGMKDFRRDFEEVLAGLPAIERVVVLVDDLDRCLPSDVLGAFEAIKLFLSVKRMGFVIAADEGFIRESLREALNRNGRGRFAERYTEKVIQLPFTLPHLTSAGAEAYITLLYAQHECEDGDQMEAIVAASEERRNTGNAPYAPSHLVGQLPSKEMALQAASMVRGMSATVSSTPRQLKRFLNNFAVRLTLLDATSSAIDAGVVMKLWILEQNFPEQFLEITPLPAAERAALLEQWESGEPDDAYSEAFRSWAGEGALLSEVPELVTVYLSLAVSTLTDVTLGGDLTSAEAVQLAGLLDSSELVRRSTQAEMEANPQQGDELVAQHVASAVQTAKREAALDSVQQIAIKRPDLVSAISAILMRPEILRSIERDELPWVGGLDQVLGALAGLHSGDIAYLAAIRDEQESGTI
jgi:hypothetical protein